MSPTYHVVATREGRGWALRCQELPTVFSHVSRLDQAAEVVREAVAFVANVAEDSFDLEVVPTLPDAFAGLAASAETERAAARVANARAAVHSREAAKVLAGAGLSVRDIGTVMGVSHQRAAQLLAG